MATVETVLGPIDVSQLGFTLPHEHLYLGDWNSRMADPEWFPADTALEEMIIPVLQDARQAGVCSLIDATPYNLGRDIRLLARAAQASGLHIIASTGIFPDESLMLRSVPEEELVNMIVREATEGVEGTGIRCGVIKCGTTELGFTEINKKTLRACGRAQRLTGLPIITHCRPANTRYGLFMQDIFQEQGADLNKVVIGHFRVGDPIDYAVNVARRGSYIAVDQMNFNAHQLDYNLELIPRLVREGLTEHLLLSHDAAIVFNHSRWSNWDHRSYINYAPNSLSYLIREPIPMLLDRGITPEQIDTIMIKNPARLFGGSV